MVKTKKEEKVVNEPINDFPMNDTPEGLGDEKWDLNFEGVSDDGNFHMEDGEYHAKVLTAEMGLSKAGKKTVIWNIEIIGGPYAGRKQKFWTSMQQNALWKLKQTLKNLGFPIDGRTQFDPVKLMGRICKVSVKNEEGRSFIDSVLPPDDDTASINMESRGEIPF